jgi:hypothetical protein
MSKAEDRLSKCVRINITLQKEIPSHCKQLLLFKKEEKKSWPINYLSPTYFLSSMGCNKVLLFIKDQTHTVCFVCGESSGFNLEFGCPPSFVSLPHPSPVHTLPSRRKWLRVFCSQTCTELPRATLLVLLADCIPVSDEIKAPEFCT